MSDKILLVDDEVNILHAYQRALRKRFNLDTANSGYEALKMVETQGPYAVVVSDMRMPGMDGIELLNRLQTMAPNMLRIMLTGNAEQKTAVDAVNRGQVYRFLNKPCSVETMAEALDGALALYHQSSAERARNTQNAEAVEDLSKRLLHQSRHDIVSGLHNRQAFEEALEQLHEETHSTGPHTLVYLDLDLFRVVNSGAGHLAGDSLLRQTAQILSASCRSHDVLARISSDEFGLLLKHTSVTEAKLLAETINSKLRHIGFEWGNHAYEVSACMGIVPIEADTHRSAAEVLGTAETACNVAKDHGHGQLHVANINDPELTRRINEVQWVSRINHALQNNVFRLYYQTIAPIGTTAEGDHFELLLRMEDENGDTVSPDAFLPAAEHYHLSPQIDRWVIQTFVQWLEQNPAALDRLSVCAINLSGHSLGDAKVLDDIQHIFAHSPIPPHKICFEITETAAIANLNNANQFIRELKARQFLFALDDFGSGLSSFAYLRNLSVDYLKIDGLFIKNLHQDEIDRAMVTSIREIAQVMGKKTVAEYVNNEETLQVLEAIGIDYAQGYYIAEPRPLEHLADAFAADD